MVVQLTPTTLKSNFKFNRCQQDDELDLRTIIESMLEVVAYSPSKAPAVFKNTSDALEKAINEEVTSWYKGSSQDFAVLADTTKKAVSTVQYFYSRHAFEVKFVFGLYTWFFFYIDDNADWLPLEDYQRRHLFGESETEPGLRQFDKVLGRLYEHWDQLCANTMVCAAFEFVTASVLEIKKEICEMKVQPTALRWPTFLRAKSGMAPGFSCAIFPKHIHPDVAAYIQVLPDIDRFMCLVNDVLSFYKEELAGETTNYVQLSARIEQKHSHRVLVEMVQEVGELHDRIAATLQEDPTALQAWLTFEYGYIAWHLALKRYKLSELGVSQGDGESEV
ncbi:terpene synthase [Favolaschia claudopus]|uniref:Terpene synthase n=1 Tax=Favolaschia claudopus TaxID=2862362 RepID=A0AAW0DYR5_9AGAR